MKICLYIPCRNGASTLPEVFEAIGCQVRKPDVLLLVNDQSSDATVALAQAAGWHVVHTTEDRNGLSSARNIAAAVAHEAGCDLIAGLDADAVPAPNYIEQLYRFYDNHPEVAATCGNMRERYVATVSDRWRSVYMSQHWGDHPVENPPILYGSSAAHRLAILRNAGGYNELLRANFEDTELTQRMLHAGHRLAYVPSLALEHLKQDTPDSVLRMFWNWYRPPADLAGHFANTSAWLQQRHPWIWRDYAARAISDARTPGLTAITTALPWSQVMRDLHLLAGRTGVSVDLRPLIDIATEIHVTHGFGAFFNSWLRDRLEDIEGQCGTGVGDPLHPTVLANIRDHALRVIPRKGYWDDLDLSMGDLSSCPSKGHRPV